MLARRDLLVGLPSAVLMATHSRAQPRPKVIGFLSPYPGPDAQATLHVFRQAMRDLGYIEGRSFILVQRFADGKNERLPPLADELVRLRVDLILASTTNAVKAAQAATSTIPIVFESVADPVAAGFAESISHPGRNITGVTNFSADLSPKRFQMLTQMVPSLNRVAVLVNISNPYYLIQKPSIESVAARLGLRVQFVDASTAEARLSNHGRRSSRSSPCHRRRVSLCAAPKNCRAGLEKRPSLDIPIRGLRGGRWPDELWGRPRTRDPANVDLCGQGLQGRKAR